jgi:hypothetical protein
MAHWLVDTPGIGSLIAIGIAVAVLAADIRLLRWIRSAPAERAAPSPGTESKTGTGQK